MPLTVTATSTDDVYTTTSYVKSLLGVTGTSHDVTLNALIRAASRWADTYVGWNLAAAKYRETVAGYQSRRLMVNQTPIRSIALVVYGTDTGNDAELVSSEFRLESREAGFLSRDEGWAWTVPVEMELTLRPRPGHEYKPWLIDYVAGYSYNGIDPTSSLYSTAAHGTTSTSRTLPEDIEHAVALRTIAMFSGMLSARGDIKSVSVGDLEVDRHGLNVGGNQARKGPEEIILSAYQRVV
jgi:uncharacterized phiE125 gp8 family phage protein